MLVDRATRARVNQLAHRIGQQTAQVARQRIADRLEVLRAAGADGAALDSFLVRCEQFDDIADLLDL
mgnify:CR=1 FL=1